MRRAELVEAVDFSDWIERMRVSGFMGFHSESNISAFNVSEDGNIIFFNGTSHAIPSRFTEALNRPNRRFYVIKLNGE